MEMILLWNQKVRKLLVKILTMVGLKKEEELYYIGGSETLPPPLSAKEEEEILQKLCQQDESVRKVLVERNLRLVVYIAKKFENASVRNRRFDFHWNHWTDEGN